MVINEKRGPMGQSYAGATLELIGNERGDKFARTRELIFKKSQRPRLSELLSLRALCISLYVLRHPPPSPPLEQANREILQPIAVDSSF
jgi:hypothetical protein